MTEDELFKRQEQLTVERDDLSDQITNLSLKIEDASEGLRQAKASYLIDPSSKQLADQLSASQTSFDSLIAKESDSIRERNDLVLALETIDSRISVLQAKRAKLEQSNINNALPAKMEELEQGLVSAVAALIAIRSHSGQRGADASLVIGNVLNKHRESYIAQLEAMKSELFEELKGVAA